jgi:hypothetical protein
MLTVPAAFGIGLLVRLTREKSNAMCEFRFSLYGLCFSRAFYHVASRRKRRKFAHRVSLVLLQQGAYEQEQSKGTGIASWINLFFDKNCLIL